MDLRIIKACILAALGVGIYFPLHSQGVSFGALDMIGGSQAEASSAGVLESIIQSASGRENSMSGGLGALDVVVSSGPVSAGALDFISSSATTSHYYSSGAWLSDANAQRKAIWTGQQYFVPDASWGRITSGFGYRPRFGRMHKGIDIAMAVGDTVCAPLPGVVEKVSYEARGYGHYVIVRHEGGLETRYAHLSRTLVLPGDPVDPMSPIALSGNTGNSTGPHLHFETRIYGEAIDPTTFFDFTGGIMRPRQRGEGVASVSYSRDGIGALNQVTIHGKKGKSLEGKRTYVVRVGDTLQKIAGRAGISVHELCRLNALSKDAELTPGTMLRISR